jgi:hypothetical protein
MEKCPQWTHNLSSLSQFFTYVFNVGSGSLNQQCNTCSTMHMNSCYNPNFITLCKCFTFCLTIHILKGGGGRRQGHKQMRNTVSTFDIV